ncbi:Os11g0452400, partial [Oryza sativa Japonica Group]
LLPSPPSFPPLLHIPVVEARLQESQAASRDVGGGAVFSAFPRRWTRNRRGWGRHVIRQRRRGDPVAAPRPLLLLLLLSCLLALVFPLSWRLLCLETTPPLESFSVLVGLIGVRFAARLQLFLIDLLGSE